MSNYWEQKRKEPRISLRVPVTIRGQDTDAVPFAENTYTDNVSRSGACVITTHRMNIGAVLDFEAFGKFSSQARVSIVWIDSDNPQNYKMGVKFMDPVTNWIVK